MNSALASRCFLKRVEWMAFQAQFRADLDDLPIVVADIHKIFERSCEIGLWHLTANRVSEIFGVRLDKRLRGKLATVSIRSSTASRLSRLLETCLPQRP